MSVTLITLHILSTYTSRILSIRRCRPGDDTESLIYFSNRSQGTVTEKYYTTQKDII